MVFNGFPASLVRRHFLVPKKKMVFKGFLLFLVVFQTSLVRRHFLVPKVRKENSSADNGYVLDGPSLMQ